MMKIIQKYCQDQLDEALECLKLCKDEVESLEDYIREKTVPELAKNKRDAELRELLDEISSLIQLREDIEKLIGYLNNKAVPYEETNDDDVLSRTSYDIKDGIMKVKTERGDDKEPYTNNIPLALFEEISLTILEQFERYNRYSITQSQITTIVSDTIKQKSNYKNSPQTVVYRCILVLILEGLLEKSPDHSRRYVKKVNKEVFMRKLNSLIAHSS